MSSNSVLTIGTFDLCHWGHVEFLKRCASLGDLIVGVNTDDFAGTFKPKPIMNQMERWHALNTVGYECLFNYTAGKELIEFVEPDVLVVGSDWARKDYLKQIDVTQDWLDERHIILAYVPYIQTMPISSTELKRRIRES